MESQAKTPSVIILKSLEGDDPIELKGQLVVGRGSGCDVTLKRGCLSREHARLSAGYGHILVEDLGSTNGTFVNKVRVDKPTLARHGDVIHFDTLVYQVSVDSVKKDNGNTAAGKLKSAGKLKPMSKPKSAAKKPNTVAQPEAKGKLKPAAKPGSSSQSKIAAKPKAQQANVVKAKNVLKTKDDAAKTKDNVVKAKGNVVKTKNIAKARDSVAQVKKQEPAAVPEEHSTGEKSASKHSRAVPAQVASSQAKPGQAKPAQAKPAQVVPLDSLKKTTMSRDADTVEKSRNSAGSGPMLVGVSGVLKDKVFKFNMDEKLSKWEIGRDDACDVQLNDVSVSNNHAQLIHEGTRWKLIDLISANGTYVNGTQGLTNYLSSGDIVRFGQVELVFKLSEENQDSIPGGDDSMLSDETAKSSGAGRRLALIGFVVVAVAAAAAYFYLKYN